MKDYKEVRKRLVALFMCLAIVGLTLTEDFAAFAEDVIVSQESVEVTDEAAADSSEEVSQQDSEAVSEEASLDNPAEGEGANPEEENKPSLGDDIAGAIGDIIAGLDPTAEPSGGEEKKDEEQGQSDEDTDEASVFNPANYTIEYERNENGNLMLDENGNPIIKAMYDENDVLLPEIPADKFEFKKDEDGNIVLDENGNPILIPIIADENNAGGNGSGAADECQHEFEVTDNGDGTHTCKCKLCGEEFTESCTYEDGVCVKCGHKEKVEEEECQHEFTYVDNGDGTHTKTCELCGVSEIEDCEFVDGECVKCHALEKKPCEHSTYEYKCNEDGTHDVLCAECGELIETVDCEYDEEGFCKFCGFEDPDKYALEEWTYRDDARGITVSGVMPVGGRVDIKDVSDKFAENVINSKLEDEDKKIEVIDVFDIKIFYKYGEEYQPCDHGEEITVSFDSIQEAADGEQIEVIRFNNATGDFKEMPTEVAGDEVSVVTDHFTSYAISKVDLTGTDKTFSARRIAYIGKSNTSYELISSIKFKLIWDTSNSENLMVRTKIYRDLDNGATSPNGDPLYEHEEYISPDDKAQEITLPLDYNDDGVTGIDEAYDAYLGKDVNYMVIVEFGGRPSIYYDQNTNPTYTSSDAVDWSDDTSHPGTMTLGITTNASPQDVNMSVKSDTYVSPIETDGTQTIYYLVGDKDNFYTTLTPKRNRTITYSTYSANSILKVDPATGAVEAMTAGKDELYISCAGKKGTIKVEVYQPTLKVGASILTKNSEGIYEVEYKGTPIEPTVELFDGSDNTTCTRALLTTDRTNVGLKNMSVTANGHTFALQYQITAKSLVASNFSSDKSNYKIDSADGNKVTVTASSTSLVQNTDFTAAIVPGTGKTAGGKFTYDVKLTGIGNYTGSVTISDVTVASSTTNLSDVIGVRWKNGKTKFNITYTGTELKPEVSGVKQYEFYFKDSAVVGDVNTFISGLTGWKEKYSDNIDASLYQGKNAKVTFSCSDYAGELTLEYIIDKADIANAAFNFQGKAVGQPAYYERQSTAITPVVEINYDGQLLTEDTHYKVSYTNNLDIGTAHANISGINNFKGTKNLPFTIRYNFETDATVVNNGTTNFTYNGKDDVHPAIGDVTIYLKYGGNSQIEPSQTSLGSTNDGYYVTFSDEKYGATLTGNAGTKYINCYGTGLYDGLKTFGTYTIDPLPLTESNFTWVAGASGAAGEFYYRGSAIEPELISDSTDYSSRIGGYKLTYVDGNGATQNITNSPTESFEVAYPGNHTNASDDVKMQITGKGNFTGTFEKSFKIKPLNIGTTAGIKVFINETGNTSQDPDWVYEAEYTTRAIEPKVSLRYSYTDNLGQAQSIVIHAIKDDDSADLKKHYTNNINVRANTATDAPKVVVSAGNGNITGTKEFKFTIKAPASSEFDVSLVDNSKEYVATKVGTDWVFKNGDDIYETPYTGKTISKPITVKVGDKTLTKEKDYEVDFASSPSVGDTTVTITGIGNYSSISKVVKFKLVAKSLDIENGYEITAPATIAYGSDIDKSTVVVKDKARPATLAKDVDYTIDCVDSNDPAISGYDKTTAGEKYLKITGTGNYKDTIYVKYVIGVDINDTAFTLKNGVTGETYTATRQATVMDGTEEKLINDVYKVPWYYEMGTGSRAPAVDGITADMVSSTTDEALLGKTKQTDWNSHGGTNLKCITITGKSGTKYFGEKKIYYIITPVDISSAMCLDSAPSTGLTVGKIYAPTLQLQWNDESTIQVADSVETYYHYNGSTVDWQSGYAANTTEFYKLKFSGADADCVLDKTEVPSKIDDFNVDVIKVTAKDDGNFTGSFNLKYFVRSYKLTNGVDTVAVKSGEADPITISYNGKIADIHDKIVVTTKAGKVVPYVGSGTGNGYRIAYVRKGTSTELTSDYIGEVTAYIIGTGNYGDGAPNRPSIDFKIESKSGFRANVKKNYTFDGNEKKPGDPADSIADNLDVIYGDGTTIPLEKLRYDVDYVIKSYANNIKPGATAQVTVSGKTGSTYSGDASANFKIEIDLDEVNGTPTQIDVGGIKKQQIETSNKKVRVTGPLAIPYGVTDSTIQGLIKVEYQDPSNSSNWIEVPRMAGTDTNYEIVCDTTTIGATTIKLVGKDDSTNNYMKGTITLNVNCQANLGDEIPTDGSEGKYVKLDNNVLSYTGDTEYVRPTVSIKTGSFRPGVDYTLTWPETGSDTYTTVGKKTVTITPKSEAFKKYYGDSTATLTYYVKYDLARSDTLIKILDSSNEVTEIMYSAPQDHLAVKALFGTGQRKEVTLNLLPTHQTVFSGSGLKVTLSDELNTVGDYTIKVEAASSDYTTCDVIGSYHGNNIPFKVKGEALGDWFEIGATNYTYTGTQISPAVAKKAGAPSGLTFRVEYGENINVGTGTITVIGTGGYTGSTRDLSFTIDPKSVEKTGKLDSQIKATITSNPTYIGWDAAVGGNIERVIPEINFVYNSGVFNKTMTEGVDYDLEVINNQHSTAKAVATDKPTYKLKGKGNFSGIASEEFTIDQLDVASANITLEASETEYTGKAINIESLIKVKNGESFLHLTEDYTVKVYDASGLNQINTDIVNTADYTIRITGQNDCRGYKDFRYSVKGRALNKHYTNKYVTSGDGKLVFTEGGELTVTVDDQPTFTAGTPVTTNVRIEDKGLTPNYVLGEGTDYTVEYFNNTVAGTGDYKRNEFYYKDETDNTISSLKPKEDSPYVVITGIGNYSGSIAIAFSIGKDITDVVENKTEIVYRDPSGTPHIPAAGELTVSNISMVYNGKYQCPTPTIRCKNASGTMSTLLKGRDFDYTIEDAEGNADINSKDAGQKYLVIKGMGSFCGVIRQPFVITKKQLQNDTEQNFTKTGPFVHGDVKITVKTTNLSVLDETKAKKLYDEGVLGADYLDLVGYYYASYDDKDVKPEVTLVDTALRSIPIDPKDYTVTYDEVAYNAADSLKSKSKIRINFNSSDANDGLGLNYFSRGSYTIDYLLLPKEINSQFNVYYNNGSEGDLYWWDAGREITPVVRVENDNGLEIDPENYEVTYSNNTLPGIATVTVKGKKNYTGTFVGKFYIHCDIADENVIACTKRGNETDGYTYDPVVDQQMYTGGPIVPNVVLCLRDYTGVYTELQLDRDYSMVGEPESIDNRHFAPGTQGKVLYRGNTVGDLGVLFTGDKVVTYDIVFDESLVEVTNNEGDYKYTSKPVLPDFKLNIPTAVITKTDYYRNGMIVSEDEYAEKLTNVAGGEITADIFYKIGDSSEYHLQTPVTYNIVKRKLSDCSYITPNSERYRKTQLKPDVCMYINNNGKAEYLKEGVDYEVKYGDNIYGIGKVIFVNKSENLEGTEFTTIFNIYLGAPTSVKAEAAGKDAVKATILPDIYASETRVELRKVSNDGTEKVVQTHTLRGRDYEFTFTGLSSTTAYKVYAKSYAKIDGIDRYSKTVASKSEAITDIDSQSIVVESNAAGTATIKWDPSGDVLIYKIYRAENATDAGKRVASYPASAGSYTNSGLTPGSTYYYYVEGYAVIKGVLTKVNESQHIPITVIN